MVKVEDEVPAVIVAGLKEQVTPAGAVQVSEIWLLNPKRSFELAMSVYTSVATEV